MNGNPRYNAEFSQLPTTETEEVEVTTVFDESRDIEEELLHGQIAMPPDTRGDNPLDILISQVGYGSFQKKLLILCGFGWLADNMWLQCIAIILPRVQDHFDVEDKLIGTLSSSIFMGMMFGALFWGTYSDSNGRKIPFNTTLTITALFGFAASFAPSFWVLCLFLFCLGFGVGGNMPTDGALFLEFLPKSHHYLLTFMSVFFSFGAVIASVLGFAILPYTSCPEGSADDPNPPCDVSVQNRGWRYMLFATGVVTFLMVVCRSFLFHLPESPKFLISRHRKREAAHVLQRIANANGTDMTITVADLPDPCSSVKMYSIADSDDDCLEEEEGPKPRSSDSYSDTSPILSPANPESKLDHPKSITQKIKAVLSPEKLQILFNEKWRVTTILVWAIWTFTAMAYTMFNVFLPKYLEMLGFAGESPPTRADVYWDYMVYSIAGVPGSVIASWMIETRLGRKGTMALSAFGSAGALFIFSVISSRITMLLSSSAVSFLATLLYAVIYGYTPEVFTTEVRGTAVGTASALGRIAGIVSPIASGILLTISTVVPLYVSVIGFVVVGGCVLLLPVETKRAH
ncbi:major facilitator superfamily domain-containing protein [Umbelopsis sp. PMI_123]|nr:major facilitator superfamily domain-containing protein [Umbelopsis sp. PMI_123]